jgi:hypothetical protein
LHLPLEFDLPRVLVLILKPRFLYSTLKIDSGFCIVHACMCACDCSVELAMRTLSIAPYVCEFDDVQPAHSICVFVRLWKLPFFSLQPLTSKPTQFTCEWNCLSGILIAAQRVCENEKKNFSFC